MRKAVQTIRGWTFLQQAWQMAAKDKDLIKPSVYAMVVGLIVSVVGLVSNGAGSNFSNSGL